MDYFGQGHLSSGDGLGLSQAGHLASVGEAVLDRLVYNVPPGKGLKTRELQHFDLVAWPRQSGSTWASCFFLNMCLSRSLLIRNRRLTEMNFTVVCSWYMGTARVFTM